MPLICMAHINRSATFLFWTASRWKRKSPLFHELHNHDGGHVHGDLRETSFFVRDEKFLLLSFDWAGPVGKSYYPIHAYRQSKGICRPDGARGGMEIVPQHDLDILKKSVRLQSAVCRLLVVDPEEWPIDICVHVCMMMVCTIIKSHTRKIFTHILKDPCDFFSCTSG